MRRAALSLTALQLPASPSASAGLQIVSGRQTVVRHGVFFTVIGKHRRSVYQQLDGEIILASECKCVVDWPEDGGPFGLSFEILRNAACPIDEHQRLSLEEMQAQDQISVQATGPQTVQRNWPTKQKREKGKNDEGNNTADSDGRAADARGGNDPTRRRRRSLKSDDRGIAQGKPRERLPDGTSAARPPQYAEPQAGGS